MVVRVKVKVDELELPGAELEQLEVRQALGEHTHCELAFIRDEASSLKLEDLLAKDLTVEVTQDDGPKETLFVGIVTSGTESYLINGGSRFTVEAGSKSIRLEHRRVRTYQDQRASDVASTLAAEAGLASHIDATSVTYEHLLQYGESDFEMCLRLADENGMFVRTTGEKLEILKAFVDSGVEVTFGADLLAFSSRVALANNGYKGGFYQIDKKQVHRFHGVRKTPTWLGGAATLTKAAVKASKEFGGAGDHNVEVSAFRAHTMGEFKAILERESERVLGRSVLARGSSENIQLEAGSTITVKDASRFALGASGKFGLIEVVHRVDASGYANDFVATPWTNYSSLRRPARRLIPGLFPALVTENNDPDKLGRVKVRYAWLDDDCESHWVRLARPDAGKDRGMLFIPEVDDEVLVGFAQGDPERPYIVGALWNGVDTPPEHDDSGTNNVRTIVTRSGHTIKFDDEDGKETVEIHSAEGQCFVKLANEDKTITVHSEGDIAFVAKKTISLDCENLIHKTKQDLYSDIGGNETVDVKQNAVLKAGAEILLDGNANVTLKAGANFNATAGGVANIKGSMVQIQPPALVVPPVVTQQPQAPQPQAFEKQPVPKPAKAKVSADKPTPRK